MHFSSLPTNHVILFIYDEPPSGQLKDILDQNKIKKYSDLDMVVHSPKSVFPASVSK